MNFDIILDGKNEFYKNLNNKTYKILKVDTIDKENYMTTIFNDFIKSCNNLNDKHYLGIDFEFKQVAKTDKEVALMQINLENNSNIGYIFILYPPSLIKENYNIMIELISHPNMIKILHGAESLDIPYLFNQVLIEPNKINNFCSNFYDTRYLCEYYHNANKIVGKCSIYNLLLEFKIVTQKKIDELDSIEKITGPIYLITIDIYKLSPEILRYSLYDVIFLPELIKKFISLGYEYNSLIPQITCVINKYKRNIEDKINKLGQIVNSLNICYIFDNNKIVILKDIWEYYYYSIFDSNNYINNLREINYFKAFLEIITKCIVYSNILKYFKVLKNKNEFTFRINFSGYFNWFIKYEYINKIILEFNKLVINDLNRKTSEFSLIYKK